MITGYQNGIVDLFLRKGGNYLTTSSAMGSLLSELGEVVTSELTWVGNVVTTITSNPFLLLTTGILVLGAAVGVVGRLLSRG